MPVRIHTIDIYIRCLLIRRECFTGRQMPVCVFSVGVNADGTGRKLIKFHGPRELTGILWHQQKARGGGRLVIFQLILKALQTTIVCWCPPHLTRLGYHSTEGLPHIFQSSCSSPHCPPSLSLFTVLPHCPPSLSSHEYSMSMV